MVLFFVVVVVVVTMILLAAAVLDDVDVFRPKYRRRFRDPREIDVG